MVLTRIDDVESSNGGDIMGINIHNYAYITNKNVDLLGVESDN